MSLADSNYGMMQSVSREMLEYHPEYWNEVKRKFSHALVKDIVEPIVDDGNYHVIKLDIMREDRFDTINFYMKLQHSIAHVRHMEIMQMDEMPIKIPETAKLACRYCGNVLFLDKRGGCSACGAPAGKSFV